MRPLTRGRSVTNTRASALLALLAAPVFAHAAAAAPRPNALSQVAERPPPALGPEEKQMLEEEPLDGDWLEQQPYVPGPTDKPRPPAKLAPSQTGAKQAPSGAHPETAPEARQRTQTLRQVSGVVLGMKVVEVRGAGDENVVALIKTDRGDRRLAIDLGPMAQLDRTDLHVGGRITAEGYVVAVRDQQFLVATRVKAERGAVVNIVRRSQARLHRARGTGVARSPASEAPLTAPNQGQPPPLPPPDALDREPLPPPQMTQPPPEDGSLPRNQAPARRSKPKSLIEQQQRPGGD
jgi:hypothetical protein